MVAAIWRLSIGTHAFAAALSSSENDSDAWPVVVCVTASADVGRVHQWLTFIELPLTNELHGEYSITRSLIAAREHGGGRAAPSDHGFPEENIIDYIITADCSIIEEVKRNTS